jgi:hypothetical protein
LNRAVRGVEGLATSLVDCSSRHGGALAAGAFPPVLGEPLEEVIDGETGSTARQPSGPHVDSNFGTSKSLVACTAHSRRVAETRNRGFRTDRVAHLADRQAAAVAGVTMASDCCHRSHSRRIKTQKSLSAVRMSGFRWCRLSTANCCRRTKFSKRRSRRDCRSLRMKPKKSFDQRNMRVF